MWIMISNSLDNDFIDGDIHSLSCKKKNFILLFIADLAKSFQFQGLKIQSITTVHLVCADVSNVQMLFKQGLLST